MPEGIVTPAGTAGVSAWGASSYTPPVQVCAGWMDRASVCWPKMTRTARRTRSAGQANPADFVGTASFTRRLANTGRLLASAAGHMGSCAMYLYQTVMKLEEHGIHDRRLWQLQELVALNIAAKAKAGDPSR